MSLASSIFGKSSSDDKGERNDDIFAKKIDGGKMIKQPPAVLPSRLISPVETVEKIDSATKIKTVRSAVAEKKVGGRVKGGKKRVRALKAKQQEAQTLPAAATVKDESSSVGNDTAKENSHENDHKADTSNDTNTYNDADDDEINKVVDEEKDNDSIISAPRSNDKNERTIFVGNLPSTTTRKSLQVLFSSCGKIESTRIRGVAVQGVKLPKERAGDQRLMKKVCVNTGLVDNDVKQTVHGYIVFVSADSVPEALKMNNRQVDGDFHIRVDTASPTIDAGRSVFVGGLPYGAKEEELREHFVENASVEVENVRIIRDNETKRCKGFAYVLFKDKNMVIDALRLDGTKCCKRKIRVQVCGKRFKGNRGHETARSSSSFEGRRSTDGGARRVLSKMKSKGIVPSSATSLPRGRKRKSVGERNTSKKKGGHEGLSKRAVSEAKINKRVKKLQKRVRDGMGKNKR